MTISLVDAIIILMILMGAIVGFKNGAIKEGTKFIGLFIVIIISFILKDKLMIIMYENLPFFNFFGLLKGLDAINILLYQLIAFLVIFAGFMFVLKVIVVITGMVEWLLKMTVFLSIPSKIIGLFVGALEFYVYLFIALYVLNMPIFNLTLVSESKFGTSILENTPILSELVDDTVDVYSDVWNVIKNRDDMTDKQVNTFVLATLLDNKLITIESAKELVESNHIIIEDNSILDQYEEGESFFEKIGGCYFIGGCDIKEEILTTYIYSTNDSITYDDTKITINSISDEFCVSSRTCQQTTSIEVNLTIKTSNDNKEYTITTNDDYKLIKNTNIYIRATIENGCLVIILAK